MLIVNIGTFYSSVRNGNNYCFNIAIANELEKK